MLNVSLNTTKRPFSRGAQNTSTKSTHIIALSSTWALPTIISHGVIIKVSKSRTEKENVKGTYS